jgi:methionyl-tRNA formyltransferase
MIKAPILALPRLGCLNLHGSLLPRYRGRAPVNWVLVHGESETGVTLHYMDEKPDHGEIVGQRRVAVERADTALTLYRKLAVAARGLLDEVLPLLAAGRAPRIPQDHKQSSYFGGRRPEDGRIDWSGPAERAYNLVRAVARPWPGAFTGFRGKKLIVWWGDTVPGPGSQAPGTLAEHRGSIAIQTGQGMFVPLRVQLEGEGETDWVEFVRTRDARAGEILK